MEVARKVRRAGSGALQRRHTSARQSKVPVALIDPLALRRASLQSMLTTACPDLAMSVFADVADLISETGARSKGFSAGVGLMLSGMCIPASASTPSGTTCATDGSGIQDFVSTTCC